jgi:selenocysteine lyase/cysteine desulfurase
MPCARTAKGNSPSAAERCRIDVEASVAENVAPRIGRVRISPHVYNDEEDIDRFVATFRRLGCS